VSAGCSPPTVASSCKLVVDRISTQHKGAAWHMSVAQDSVSRVTNASWLIPPSSVLDRELGLSLSGSSLALAMARLLEANMMDDGRVDGVVLTNDGCKLAFSQWGTIGADTSKPAVVLIHGWSGSRHYFRDSVKVRCQRKQARGCAARHLSGVGRPLLATGLSSSLPCTNLVGAPIWCGAALHSALGSVRSTYRV
jgi:hypothetical protein